MPSDPPNSRVVSFMAEPIPARLRGTADISSPVVGDMASAIPTAMTTMPPATWA